MVEHRNDDLPGQMQMLQSLCPKWSGTWAQVDAFTREAMLAAPPGSPQGALVVDGFIERALDGDVRAYLIQPHVRAAIDEAAQRSVWHPDFARGYGWVWAANMFAAAYSGKSLS